MHLILYVLLTLYLLGVIFVLTLVASISRDDMKQGRKVRGWFTLGYAAAVFLLHILVVHYLIHVISVS